MFFYFISRVNFIYPQCSFPRNLKWVLWSCTVYTQCLNRGLYVKRRYHLFILFWLLFMPIGVVNNCKTVNIINIKT